MPTRTCPGVFANGCGAGPCARFESDSIIPWVETERQFVEAFEEEWKQHFRSP